MKCKTSTGKKHSVNYLVKDLVSGETAEPCQREGANWKCESENVENENENENVVSNKLSRVKLLLWEDSKAKVSNASPSLKQLTKV